MTISPTSSWWRLEIDPSGDLEESLIWRLETLGISRVAVKFKPDQPGHRTLLAWLPAADWPASERKSLEQALCALAEPFGLELPQLSWQQQPEEDWSHSWKQHWAPDPVGEKLLILPAWLQCRSPGDCHGSGQCLWHR